MDTFIIGIVAIIFFSALMGWFFSRSKKAEKPVAVMLFVLYFWLFVFIQLIIFAVLSHFEIVK